MADAKITNPHHGILLQDRIVPFPISISPQAKTKLQNLVTAQGTPVNALHHLPAADDTAAWQALQEHVNSQYELAVKAQLSNYTQMSRL